MTIAVVHFPLRQARRHWPDDSVQNSGRRDDDARMDHSAGPEPTEGAVESFTSDEDAIGKRAPEQRGPPEYTGEGLHRPYEGQDERTAYSDQVTFRHPEV